MDIELPLALASRSSPKARNINSRLPKSTSLPVLRSPVASNFTCLQCDFSLSTRSRKGVQVAQCVWCTWSSALTTSRRRISAPSPPRIDQSDDRGISRVGQVTADAGADKPRFHRRPVATETAIPCPSLTASPSNAPPSRTRCVEISAERITPTPSNPHSSMKTTTTMASISAKSPMHIQFDVDNNRTKTLRRKKHLPLPPIFRSSSNRNDDGPIEIAIALPQGRSSEDDEREETAKKTVSSSPAIKSILINSSASIPRPAPVPIQGQTTTSFCLPGLTNRLLQAQAHARPEPSSSDPHPHPHPEADPDIVRARPASIELAPSSSTSKLRPRPVSISGAYSIPIPPPTTPTKPRPLSTQAVVGPGSPPRLGHPSRPYYTAIRKGRPVSVEVYPVPRGMNDTMESSSSPPPSATASSSSSAATTPSTAPTSPLTPSDFLTDRARKSMSTPPSAFVLPFGRRSESDPSAVAGPLPVTTPPPHKSRKRFSTGMAASLSRLPSIWDNPADTEAEVVDEYGEFASSNNINNSNNRAGGGGARSRLSTSSGFSMSGEVEMRMMLQSRSQPQSPSQPPPQSPSKPEDSSVHGKSSGSGIWANLKAGKRRTSLSSTLKGFGGLLGGHAGLAGRK